MRERIIFLPRCVCKSISGKQPQRKTRQSMRLVSAACLATLLLNVLGFPALCEGWSNSASKSIPYPMMMALSADLKMMQQEQHSLSMLLNNQYFPSVTLLTSPHVGRKHLDRHQDESAISKQSENRGRVLGFDVFETQATRSNVNLETWNGGKNGASFQPHSGLIWNPNAQKDSAGISFAMRPGVLPAWFPFLPTKSQIQSLKVTEIKEACRIRQLSTVGKKADLQERLWQWTLQQQQQHQEKLTGDFLTNFFEEAATMNDFMNSTTSIQTIRDESSTSPNSLAEWSRLNGPDHLREKRKEIHRKKREGRPAPKKRSRKEQSTKEYLLKLSKSLQKPSSPYSSNVEVKELYMASKKADQLGERKVAIELLETLLKVTPNDARVYRRLSRMYSEQGDLNQARKILHTGIRLQPDNPWLWHGLAQLEQNHGSSMYNARRCYRKAIQVDPTFPHAYHALGTLEHTEGNIPKAMKILRQGIEFCPTNHRLHHALGDLYRGAKLLEDAERSYHRALEHGSPVNYCFAYSALACVAFERNQITDARKWLQRSVRLNNGRHSQGWVSLAQMEESQGNIEEARSTCMAGITQYERGLIEMRQRYKRKPFDKTRATHGAAVGKRSPVTKPLDANPLDAKNLLLKAVPKYRSGDKFINVYRNWARLEEKYGSFESVDQVYERASIAFPLDFRVTLDWASYHATMHNYDRARSLYVDACSMASNRHAGPYRVFAELEMSLGNYEQARKILFYGAQAVSKSQDGGLGSRRGLAELFHTWATCEWHLGNLPRAEVLYDHALRLTEVGDEGCELRSFILYSIARLEYYRGELLLAQHCVGLCLKESGMQEKSKVWGLWADIANAMDNPKLEEQCRDHESVALEQEAKEDELSSLFDPTSRKKLVSLRRDPWQLKLFGVETQGKTTWDFCSKVKFPAMNE